MQVIAHKTKIYPRKAAREYFARCFGTSRFWAIAHSNQHYQELELSDRKWTCPFCGTTHDSDVNVAMNLRQLAAHPAEMINACGADYCRVEAGKAKEV